MINDNFDWECPKCERENSDHTADDEKTYICLGCGEEFLMTFSVQVVEIEHYDKSKIAAERESSFLVSVEISRDKGKTWEKTKIDRRVVDQDKSPLRVGDLVKVTGRTMEVGLRPNNTLMLNILHESSY